MRDIKFKIYDKELKESHIERLQDLCEDDYWYDGETDMWSVLYDSHNEQERFVALQYTGLKDKNGIEIYEGDIVKIDCPTMKMQGKVFYCENGADFRIYDEIEDIEETLWYQQEEYEVVGNIYDNPELLKEAKI